MVGLDGVGDEQPEQKREECADDAEHRLDHALAEFEVIGLDDSAGIYLPDDGEDDQDGDDDDGEGHAWISVLWMNWGWRWDKPSPEVYYEEETY